MTRFYCYHGSPGTMKDFSLIQNELVDSTFVDMSYRTQLIEERGTILAYSWGSVRALNDLTHYANLIDEVILIAPYTRPKNKAFMSALLNAPGIGNFLLGKLGKKSIEKFINESCSPLQAPERYKIMAKELSDPCTIRTAMNEKQHIAVPSDHELSKLNVKVTIIWGDGDKTSAFGEQIAPLLKAFKDSEVIKIKGGGHALSWTHPKTLAQYLKGERGDISHLFDIGYHEGMSPLNNVYSFLDDHLVNRPDKQILRWVEKDVLSEWDNNIETPLKHEGVTVTGLHQKVEAIAAGYIKLGLKKGDRVILFIPMSLDLYAAMFALQKIGAIPVFLDSWARRDQIGTAARSVMPRAMVSLEVVFDILNKSPAFKLLPYKIVSGAHKKKYSASIEELSKTTDRVETAAMEREDTAIITFTTGSSGTPKGANRTHRFLAAQHYALGRALPYTEQDVDLPVFPIFSLNNLAAGVPTVIPAFDVGAPGEFDTQILLAQMTACNVTSATLNAHLLISSAKYCLDNGIKQENMRRVVTGGAPISRDNMIDITNVAVNAEAWVLYGSTEVEPISHIEAQTMINYKSISETDSELVDAGVNVGAMDSGLDYRFIKINGDTVLIESADDWKDLTVENGQVGELIVAGEHVCDGYYNNPDAFHRAKIRDENGVIWHRTGDLTRIDELNNIWLVGRVHNAINRNGVYAFPVRAEVIMKKLEFTKRCAYLGMPDEKLGEKTVVVVEPNDESWITDDEKKVEMTTELKRILGKNDVIIDEVVFIKDIPMDSRHNSKVEYHVLRERILKGEGSYGL